VQNGIVSEERWPPFRSWMEANRDDLIRQEQYADFVRNREFRRALICHGDVTLDRTQMLARAERMHAVALLRRSEEANGMTRFDSVRGGLVIGAGPLRDALVTISRRFPQAIAVEEVLAAAGQHRAALLRELLACWMNGMLELYVEPPVVPAQAGDKPRASPVARYLAAQHQAPVNQRQGYINVDETQRRFIQLLDGTRSRDQLGSELGTSRENVDKLIQYLMSVALLEA
jgi:methyltransferase-like protein